MIDNQFTAQLVLHQLEHLLHFDPLSGPDWASRIKTGDLLLQVRAGVPVPSILEPSLADWKARPYHALAPKRRAAVRLVRVQGVGKVGSGKTGLRSGQRRDTKALECLSLYSHSRHWGCAHTLQGAEERWEDGSLRTMIIHRGWSGGFCLRLLGAEPFTKDTSVTPFFEKILQALAHPENVQKVTVRKALLSLGRTRKLK